jgi:hypothetical protein
VRAKRSDARQALLSAVICRPAASAKWFALTSAASSQPGSKRSPVPSVCTPIDVPWLAGANNSIAVLIQMVRRDDRVG